MELFWTLESIEDRDNIYDHIEADNPTAAVELDEIPLQSHRPIGMQPAARSARH